MPATNPLGLTAFDDSLILRKGQMLVEPRPRAETISLLGGIIETVTSVPATTCARVLKMGETVHEPDIVAGDLVELIPHGGSLLPVPEKHPNRMVVPLSQAVGIWEEED